MIEEFWPWLFSVTLLTLVEARIDGRGGDQGVVDASDALRRRPREGWEIRHADRAGEVDLIRRRPEGAFELDLPRPPKRMVRKATFRLVLHFILTLAVGGAALYVMFSKAYDDDTKKWAFGTVGLLTGFWLKP